MADNRYDEAVDIVARSVVVFDGHLSETLPGLTEQTYDAIYARIRLIENEPSCGAFEATFSGDLIATHLVEHTQAEEIHIYVDKNCTSRRIVIHLPNEPDECP